MKIVRGAPVAKTEVGLVKGKCADRPAGMTVPIREALIELLKQALIDDFHANSDVGNNMVKVPSRLDHKLKGKLGDQWKAGKRSA
jgi:hypothetical protein